MNNAFNPIARTRELRAAHRKAASTSADAETLLVTAESALAVARKDDGVIDVSKLDARIAAAEGPVRLARIQADRAAAALATIEGELESEIFTLANATKSLLSAASGKAEASLIAELSPHLRDPNYHGSKSALLDFIAECSPLADCSIVMIGIDNAVRGHRLGVGSLNSVCDSIEAAAPLV